ncbi:MAG: adenine phosphoribosyltransferase, partial [Oscillospiraceae bacterium]|nr:adenine phosphoribosyltransferase [Oscillospiraceae bacterium]
MAEEFYTLQVAGLTRRLPICPVNEKLSIAAFVMFSDVEMTVACATELVKKAPKCDVIITAESKGIPLAYEMARQLGITYVVARKMPKLIRIYRIPDPIDESIVRNMHEVMKKLN